MKFASHIPTYYPQYQVKRAKQWYIVYWVGGMVGGADHKIQDTDWFMKITLNNSGIT